MTHRFQLSLNGPVLAGEGHNTTQKTYLKISTYNYWPKMFLDFDKHKKFCIRCQQSKKSMN